MSRQGLMDDSGYDFFDASDCANYESCREDAYKDGYEKGRADAIDEFRNKLFGKLVRLTLSMWHFKLFDDALQETYNELKEQNK